MQQFKDNDRSLEEILKCGFCYHLYGYKYADDGFHFNVKCAQIYNKKDNLPSADVGNHYTIKMYICNNILLHS